MIQFGQAVDRLSQELQREILDENTVSQLESCLQTIHVEEPSKELSIQLSQYALKCYDTSFKMLKLSRKTSKDFSIQCSLRMRMAASELVCLLHDMEDQAPAKMSGGTIATQGIIEMLIVTSRMAHDFGLKYAAKTASINNTVSALLKEQPVTARLMFLHYLNVIERMKYDCEFSQFNVESLQEAVRNLTEVDFRDSLPEDQKYRSDYSELVNCIILEVCLKLAKRSVDIRKLLPYVRQEHQAILQSLYYAQSANSTAPSIPGICTPLYDLYIQVRQRGFRAIDSERLRQILTQNWDQKGFFEIVCVRMDEAMPVLQLWFEMLNNQMKESELMEDAYSCYMAVVDANIDNSRLSQQLAALTMQAIRSMKMNKKSELGVLVSPLKKAMRVYLELVSTNFDGEEAIVELLFELTSAIKKLKFFEQHKSLYKVTCLYLLLRGSPKFQQLYGQYRHMVPDKSTDIVCIVNRCLTASGEDRVSAITQLIKSKSPILSLYLLLYPERIMEVPTELLVDFAQPLSCYCELAAKNIGVETLDQLTRHFHQAIQRHPLNLRNTKHLSELYSLLVGRLKKNINPQLDYRMSIVCLYCQVIVCLGDRLQQKTLSANQYFKLNYWLECLQTADISEQLVVISSVVLVKSLKKHIQLRESEGKTVFQVGQFEALQKIYRIASSVEDKKRDMLEFVMLQLQLLNESIPLIRLKQLVDAETRLQQLQLYNSIPFMPQQLRVVILRRILYASLSANTSIEFSIDDLKRLILMAESQSERLVYMKQLLMTGGDEVQTFMELVASIHPTVRAALLSDNY